MSTNPFFTGEFYTGEFLTQFPEFDFRNPLRDQRQVIMADISAMHQASLIAFSLIPVTFFTNVYYYVNSAGNLASFSDYPDYINSIGLTWALRNQVAPPRALVLIDETGTFRALTPSSFTSPGTLLVIDPDSPILTPGQLQFVGPYLTMLGEDGHSVYRITVTSDLVVHVDLYQDEPERLQSITVQNGHPFLFFNDRTYHGQLIEMGDVDIQASPTDFGFGGLLVPRIGVVKISLADQKFDFLTHQDWEDRTLTVRFGSNDESPQSFPIAVRAKTKSASWNEDSISIALRDSGIFFDRPFMTEKYAGTGGLEGDEELEGQVKPRGIGHIELVEPTRISQSLNIYQLSTNRISGIGLVSQGGINLHYNGDMPNGLFTWQPTQAEVDAGFWRSDVGNGIFRLAGPPGGRIISRGFTGEGSAPSVATNMTTLIRHICQDVIPEIPINEASFLLFNDYFPDDFMGLYLTQEITVGELLNKLVGGYGAAIGVNRLGEIFLAPMQFTAPVTFIRENDIEEGSVNRESAPSPANEYKLGYRDNLKFSNSDFLAQNLVDPFLVQNLIGPRYKTIGPLEGSLSERFPTRKLKELTSVIQNFGLAEIILNNLFQRDWALRDVYTITVRGHSWQLNIGDTVLWEHSRWGLDVPRAALVVGINERSPTFETENRTTLRLWC